MLHAMIYCVNTRDYGILADPEGVWGGKINNNPFLFSGISDSDYAKDMALRKSASGS
jgi:hypothetical protein